ncbi:hypothetical protein CAB17_09300 [Legionella sainthelensi]|nr:hypothetical protein CAB17_09300 [Legionella sainthelensi]
MMKKYIITSSALLMALSLVGCNTMNDVSQYSNSTVGAGVKYGATAVGTGVGYIADTGAFIGNGVGKVVGTGVGLVSGQPATYQNVGTYHHNQVIYHNGHRYMLKNGHYVLVH